MLKKMLVTFILTSLLTSFGCQNSQQESAFSSMFSGIPMNLALHFRKPSEDFRIGNPVSLDLENASSDEIGIPVEDGILALVFEKDKWVKLVNKAIYVPPNGERLIFPKGPDHSGVTGVDLVPQLDSSAIPIHIRVVVVGSI